MIKISNALSKGAFLRILEKAVTKITKQDNPQELDEETFNSQHKGIGYPELTHEGRMFYVEGIGVGLCYELSERLILIRLDENKNVYGSPRDTEQEEACFLKIFDSRKNKLMAILSIWNHRRYNWLVYEVCSKDPHWSHELTLLAKSIREAL